MFELFIKYNNGYQHLDIEGDGGLILETNNPLEYAFGKSHKTYSIQIPNTGNNNILLDNIFYKSYDHTIVFDDCFYKIDENIFLKGILKIYNVNNNIAEGQFVTEYSQLWTLFKNTKLSELDFSDLNHSLNATQIINSESLNLHGGDVIYDLVDRGKTKIHYLTEKHGRDNLGDIISNRVDITERLPAVKIMKIFNTIFDDYELETNFDAEDWYSKQYLLTTKHRENIKGTSQDFVNENTFNGKLGTNFINILPSEIPDGNNNWSSIYLPTFFDTDNVGYNTGNRRFTVQETGIYEVFVNISGWVAGTLNDNNNNSGIIKLDIYNNVTDDIYLSTIINHEYYNQNWFTGVPEDLKSEVLKEKTQFNINTFLPARTFTAGDIISFRVTYSGQTDIMDIITIDNVINNNNTIFKIMPSTFYGYNETVEISKYMPDIKISDFISNWLKQFNIEMYVSSEDNKILFYKRDYQEAAIDLTKYLIEADFNINHTPDRKNILFKNTLDGNDGLMKFLYERNTDINGDYLFNINALESTEFVSPFSMTVEQPIPRWGISNNNAVMWRNSELSPFFSNFNMRLLWDAGSASCSYVLTNFNTFNSRTTYRKLSTNISGFSSKFNDGFFIHFHFKNIENLSYGHELQVKLFLPATIINNFYNLTNNYWLNIFYINLNNIKGYYILSKLNNITNNYYNATFHQIYNVQTIGEFNADFNEDFN